MSAAALWVYFPFLCGFLMLFFSEKRRVVALLSLLLCGLLALIARSIPVNSMIVFGRNNLIFSADSALLGRTMSISRSEQTLIAFFYFFAALWFGGTLFVDCYRFFVPVGLMDISLLVGVMAVEPFIYGAFMVILAVLLILPVLWFSHHGDGQALTRFLLYQILGLMFLALGGWLAASVNINPQDDFLLRRTVVMLFLGFSFWLAIFPFYSWIAMLMEKTCPYICGFMISMLQFFSLFLLLNFLNSYLWMRTYQPLFEGLKLTGLLMLLIGALWTVFQKDLQRLLAFMVVAENGVSLLLLGMRTQTTINTFLSYLFLHVIVLLVWSLAVKNLEQDSSFELETLAGLFYRKPFIAGAILASFFCVAGLPLMAGFPMRMSLLAACFSTSAALGWLASAGCWILLFVGFKLLLIFLRPGPAGQHETRRQRSVLIAGIVLLLTIGFFPALFSRLISGIQSQYAVIFGG